MSQQFGKSVEAQESIRCSANNNLSRSVLPYETSSGQPFRLLGTAEAIFINQQRIGHHGIGLAREHLSPILSLEINNIRVPSGCHKSSVRSLVFRRPHRHAVAYQRRVWHALQTIIIPVDNQHSSKLTHPPVEIMVACWG